MLIVSIEVWRLVKREGSTVRIKRIKKRGGEVGLQNFHNQLIKKEEGCLMFFLPGPSSVLSRALLAPLLVLVWVLRPPVGPYVLLVGPRLESVGLLCDWSLTGSLGIVLGARRQIAQQGYSAFYPLIGCIYFKIKVCCTFLSVFADASDFQLSQT